MPGVEKSPVIRVVVVPAPSDQLHVRIVILRPAVVPPDAAIAGLAVRLGMPTRVGWDLRGPRSITRSASLDARAAAMLALLIVESYEPVVDLAAPPHLGQATEPSPSQILHVATLHPSLSWSPCLSPAASPWTLSPVARRHVWTAAGLYLAMRCRQESARASRHSDRATAAEQSDISAPSTLPIRRAHVSPRRRSDGILRPSS